MVSIPVVSKELVLRNEVSESELGAAKVYDFAGWVATSTNAIPKAVLAAEEESV